MRLKRPAHRNTGIDADPNALRAWASIEHNIPDLELIHADAMDFLADNIATFNESGRNHFFIYCDPPYLMETRASGRAIYAHEFATVEEHRELLRLLKQIRSNIAISGYAHRLYADELRGWREITFRTRTRGGTIAIEHLWMNYPEPMELHDYRYLGRNYRERERIKRQKVRWTRRLERMDTQQRHALMQAIGELRTAPPKTPIPPALSSEMACSSKPSEMTV